LTFSTELPFPLSEVPDHSTLLTSYEEYSFLLVQFSISSLLNLKTETSNLFLLGVNSLIWIEENAVPFAVTGGLEEESFN